MTVQKDASAPTRDSTPKTSWGVVWPWIVGLAVAVIGICLTVFDLKLASDVFDKAIGGFFFLAIALAIAKAARQQNVSWGWIPAVICGGAAITRFVDALQAMGW